MKEYESNVRLAQYINKDVLRRYAHKIRDISPTEYDEYSMLLFGRHKQNLDEDELLRWAEYCQDIEHPVWKKVKCEHTDKDLMVNQTGSMIIDPDTNKPYAIYDAHNSGSKYPTIYVVINGNLFIQSIHRLVAAAFVENPDPAHKNSINHINGIKECNWYKNLEWVTPKENVDHAFRTGLIRVGADRPEAIATVPQVIKVCELLQDHPELSMSKVAEMVGLPPYIVANIYDGDSWKSISKDYYFPPRQSRSFGENAGPHTYNESQIRKACELLCEHPEWSMAKIASESGISRSIVLNLYTGKSWTHVTKDYKFPQRRQIHKDPAKIRSHSVLTLETAKQCCAMLEDSYEGKKKMTDKEIGDALGIGRTTVSSIKHGNSWVEVSKDYNFYKDKYGE